MKNFFAPSFLLGALLFENVSAHFTMQYIWIDGVQQPWGQYIRMTQDNSPVTDVGSTDMICNPAGLTGTGVGTAQVRPGANISFEWHQHVNVSNELPLSFGHKGPTQIFVAQVPSAVSASDWTPTGSVWTKVYSDGLHYINAANPDGFWATDVVCNNNGVHSITLPSCLPDGDYIVRAENVALDLATSLNGAQWYIGCTHLRVNSTLAKPQVASVTPAKWASRPLYSLQNLYKATDPGVLINIYWGMTNYVIPGPAAWTC